MVRVISSDTTNPKKDGATVGRAVTGDWFGSKVGADVINDSHHTISMTLSQSDSKCYFGTN